MAVIDIYGATTDDVDQLLVWDLRTSPLVTEPMAASWIEVGAAELHGLVGDIPDTETPCCGTQVRFRARHIVALFAAAMAEDAHYPERTMDREAGDYGSRLWNRHKEQLASFVTAIQACRDGIDPGVPRGGSRHSFPSPPMFTRCMGS